MAKVRKEFIPFGDVTPDLGLYGHGGLTYATSLGGETFGALSLHRAYIPQPYVEVLPTSTIKTGSTGSTSVCAGLHTHLYGLSDWRAYTGDDADLYEYDPGTPVVANVSKSAAAYNSDEWFFTSFGGSVLATNFVDPVQILLSTAANFADCFTSTDKPLCRYLSPFKSHIVGGFYSLGGTVVPHGIFWTATDNARSVGSAAALPEQNTDYQELLDDLGAVTGLAQGLDHLLIFRDKGIVRMDGPTAAGFTFAPVSISEGCRWPRSIVQFGNDTFYFADGTVKVVRGGTVVEDIGNGAVNRLLFDPSFSEIAITNDEQVASLSSPLSVAGAVDPSSNSVIWLWNNVGTTPSGFSGAVGVAYNVTERKWSVLRFNNFNGTAFSDGSRLWRYPTGKPGIAAESWSPLSRLIYLVLHSASGTDTWSIAKFSDDGNGSGALATAFIQHNAEQRTRVRWVRPVITRYSGSPAALTVEVQSTARPYTAGAVSTVTTTSEDRDGHFLMPPGHVPDDFIRYVLSWVGGGLGTGEIKGLEVGLEEAGRSYGD